MTAILSASILLGSISGLMAGLFGIGGGLIIVPALTILFAAHHFPADMIMIMSVATSLATIIFTSIFSVRAHHRLKAVLWNKVRVLVPGIMLGAAGGTVLADYIAGDSLRWIFITYLIIVGIEMALQVKPRPGQRQPCKLLDFCAATIIGFLSSLLGIGGGTLTVPFLVHFQTPMRNAVAVSSACGLPLAIAGTVGYALLGYQARHLPEWSAGYIYLPSFFGIIVSSMFTAPIGAKLANKLPAGKLKRYFSLLLFAMAAKLIGA